MAGETTSAVFSVWRALTRILQEAQWPASPVNPGGVAVYFGDPDSMPWNQAAKAERVVIASGIGPPADSWGPIGRYAREETFIVFAYVITMVPGRSEEQTRDRLEELTTILESTVRETYATKQADEGPVELAPYGSTWVTEVSALLPIIATTSDGAIGKAEIQVRCKFRIGIPPATP